MWPSCRYPRARLHFSSRRRACSSLRLFVAQGNLLYLTLSPRFPDLAGKLVGMLLELGAEEVKEVLANEVKREELVQEALQLLRDAGDARALAVDARPAAASVVMPAPLARNPRMNRAVMQFSKHVHMNSAAYDKWQFATATVKALTSKVNLSDSIVGIDGFFAIYI